MPRLLPWNSSSTYQHPTGWGTSTKGAPGEKEAFAKVKKLILGNLQINHKKVGDFQIHPRSQTTSFTHPQTQMQMIIDLPGIEDQNIQNALGKLYDIAPNAFRDHDAVIYANCKGDQGKDAILCRNTDALKKLPTDFDSTNRIPQILSNQPSKEGRYILSRRFLLAENFLGEWKEKNSARLQEKKEQLKNPENLPDAIVLRLRKEVKDLESLQQKLKQADFYALSRFLEAFPIGQYNEDTVQRISEELVKSVLDDIKPKKLKFMNAEHSQADIDYAYGVLGGFYRDRKGFFNFCQNTFGRRKSVGMTEAVAEVSLQGKWSEKMARSFDFLLNGMSKGLKAEVQGDLNGAGVLTSYALDQQGPEQYDDANIFEGATEEEKKDPNYAQQKLREVFNAQKEKATERLKTLKLEDVPPPKDPDPGILSISRTGLGVGALGALAVGGAAAAGLIQPQMAMQLAQYVQNHPVRVLATAVGLDYARHFFNRFIYPHVRDPETGLVRRKWHKRNITMLSAAVLAATAALYFSTHANDAAGVLVHGVTHALDHIWNFALIPLFNPRQIWGTNFVWEGNVPTQFVIAAATGILNKIPYVKALAGPIHTGVRYIMLSKGVASAAATVFNWGSPYVIPYYQSGARYARNQASRVAEFADSIWQSLPALPNVARAFSSEAIKAAVSAREAPLTSM